MQLHVVSFIFFSFFSLFFSVTHYLYSFLLFFSSSFLSILIESVNAVGFLYFTFFFFFFLMIIMMNMIGSSEFFQRMQLDGCSDMTQDNETPKSTFELMKSCTEDLIFKDKFQTTIKYFLCNYSKAK